MLAETIGRSFAMKSLEELVGWGLHGYRWSPDDDLEIDFESREWQSLDGCTVTFVGSIAFSALGPWGDLTRYEAKEAMGSALRDVLDFGDDELNDYQQFTLWFGDAPAPSAIVIAESLSIRPFKMVRGMDL